MEPYTPPLVETHAATQPSVRDTLPGAAASNCRAENAIAAPQARADSAASKENLVGLDCENIESIVADSFVSAHLLPAFAAVVLSAEHLPVLRNCAPTVFPRRDVVGLHFA